MLSTSWRVLGFVPDSDDEEEIVLENQDEAIANVAPAHAAISGTTATFLDVHIPTTAYAVAVTDPPESPSEISELSSISSTAFQDSSLPPKRPAIDLEDASILTSRERNSQLGIYDWQQQYAGRTFRPRRSEQLHPYTIEQEKYRQAFRARGLRPVQYQENTPPSMAQADANDEEYSSDEETQRLQYHRLLESSSPKSAQMEENSRQPDVVADAASSTISSTQLLSQLDDDLPDLMDMLEKRKAGMSMRSFRPVKRMRHVDQSFHQQSTVDMVGDDNEALDVPFPSSRSPATHSQEPRPHADKTFRLPEPVSSLEKGRSRGSEPSTLTATMSIEISSNSGQSDDTDPGSESDASQKLMEHMAKRIKGVLPRSFALLDFRRQRDAAAKPTEASVPAPRAVRSDFVKGVARPARINISAVSGQILPSFVEPESDDNFDGRTRIAWPVETERDIHATSPRLSGSVKKQRSATSRQVLSENLLPDLMPSGQKTATLSSRRVATHARPAGERINIKSQSTKTKKSHASNRDVNQDVARRRAKHQRRATTTQIGILDVVSSPAQGSELPHFVRIAQRQARKDCEFGRSSPSFKHFILRSRGDTEDAHELLRGWGSLRQSSLNQHVRRRSNLPSPASKTQLEKRSRNSMNEMAAIISPGRRRANESENANSPWAKKTISGRKLQSFIRPSHHGSIRVAQLESDERQVGVHHQRTQFNAGLRRLGAPIVAIDEPIYDRATASHPNAVQQPQQGHDARRVDHRKKRLSRRKKPGFRKASNEVFAEDCLPHEYHDRDIKLNGSDKHSAHESLRGFWSMYSVDFDTRHLSQGAYLDMSSYVGSLDFRKIIMFQGRDLLSSVGDHSLQIGDNTYSWTTWSTTMLNQTQRLLTICYHDLERAFDTSILDAQAASIGGSVNEIAKSLRQFGLANARWLTFANADEIQHFSTVLLESLAPLLATTSKHIVDLSRRSEMDDPAFVALVQLLLITMSLCAQGITDETRSLHPSARSLIIFGAECLLKVQFSVATDVLLQYSRKQSLPEHRRSPRDQLRAETIVVVNHLLARVGPPISICNVFSKTQQQSIAKEEHVDGLEQFWHNVTTLLPLLEYDDCGLAAPGTDFDKFTDDWTIVKIVLDRLVRAHSAGNQNTAYRLAMEQYFKVWLRRVYWLVAVWNWTRTDAVLPLLFDFFAKHKFVPPAYDDVLASHNSFEIQQGEGTDITNLDNSFSIFLKLLAVILTALQRHKLNKLSTSLVWRCQPNHGRVHRKEDDLVLADLAALRNQHDLLCTLYIYGPPATRERLLSNVKDLVDHTLSHQAVCRINAKAFMNIANFEIAQGRLHMSQVVTWFNGMITAAMDQFRNAKAQIDLQYSDFAHDDRMLVSDALMQATIQSNQSQVLATMKEIVVGLSDLISRANDQSQVLQFLQAINIQILFSLLEHRWHGSKIESVVIEVLQVYETVMAWNGNSRTGQAQNPLKDESQDYGEWPEDAEDFSFIGEILYHRLSVILASDLQYDDDIILVFIRAWTKSANLRVQSLQAEWSDFSNDYGETSWARLPNTLVRQRMTPAFYASVLELDSSVFRKHRKIFLSAWLSCLLVPWPAFRFQGRLTSAILGVACDDYLFRQMPLFHNLNETFELDNITTASCRLDIISTLLQNLARRHHKYGYGSSDAYLLQDMMLAMKAGFSSLETDENGQRDYVPFVQAVVGLLQQHASHLCTVDTFFTDAAHFPVPDHDPAYIISKLKSYGQSKDPSSIKRLVFFFKTIYEHAVSDAQAARISQHIVEAMDATVEGDDHVTLRSIMLECIFSVYFQSMLIAPCGWVLAQPLLHATSAVMKSFHYKFSVTDLASMAAVDGIITTVLLDLCHAVDIVVQQPQLLSVVANLQTLATVTEVVTSSILPLDIIGRTIGKRCRASKAISFFQSFTVFCLQIMLEPGGAHDGISIQPVIRVDTPDRHVEIRQMCERELGPSIVTNWVKDGQDYYWKDRAGQRKITQGDEGVPDEQRAAFFRSIEDFHERLTTTSILQ